ncbi:hypothetical protein SAMN04488570_2131 [Nocardioides scoriae]|uniref:Uncharacterized protein n=1 Tax=Nocardioides scoriae TaxID=642780 RepID=A0A1H1T474_9ACTN|nr:hypothetical protein [Nocardioides scoriae]SDS54903.1 hypothetical protein SAMN04488570_2131 [Nocardioides scoriae]
MTARSRRALPVAVLGAAAALVLAGCGDGSGAGGGGEQPLTSRAVAAVALDHLPEDTSSRRAAYVDRTDPEGYVGADLRYGGGEGDDGDLVRVAVTPDEPLRGCDQVDVDCAEPAEGVVLVWEQEAPEEDPGYVAVMTERDGATVAALAAGPAITGDPREQADLEPSVETLVRIVSDERLAPLASAATIAAGERLGRWDGGDREEGELDEVAQTSAGLVGTFMLGNGEGWTYQGPSPVAGDLGDGAVGGRLRLALATGPIGPGVLDVAAVPEMPAWAEPDTCREGWRCWSRGETRVVWRPAAGGDPGESWLLQPSELGGVAALHTRGRPIPDDERRIRYYSGYVLWARSLTDAVEPQAIGTTTDRQGLEQAEALAAEHQQD